ncbi:MAG: AAA family ATPase [Betaproteobacteria bacterium]|nr:AAA family ATPase [Betaproteobacteria bacterium]MDE2124585.1 AAA family ATPase [Betaproteobacteria bacterium]MDE2187416.1 AAA family ATPase [Betaproteobacteria bacterium]MDE2323333.1 AAA family ATPase [Betaproteobacteria bacterium]
MIRQLEVKGLRALRYVSVDFEPFQVMVGPNASGKSTLFDALLLVRDILASGLDAAVYGNARMNIAPRAVDPLDLTWLRKGGGVEIAVTLELPNEIAEKLDQRYRYARYELGIHTDGRLGFEHETLWLCDEIKPRKPNKQMEFPYPETAPEHIVLPQNRRSPPSWRKVVSKVVESGNDYFRSETSDWNNLFRLGPTKSALANLPEDEQKFPAATWAKRVLMEGVHRLMLNAEKMRMPSPAGSPSDFLPDGSNLSWVVHALEKEGKEQVKADWVAHLATTLDDLENIETCEKPEDRSRYIQLKYKSGLIAPSWVLSDGTLRLLALTLLAYAPTTPNVVLIEEPENGIHPKAMETVMQSLSSVYDAQVLCATHSPVVLSLLESKQILCFGKTDEGAIDIVRGSDHPRLRDWKSALNLGELFATGVLG